MTRFNSPVFEKVPHQLLKKIRQNENIYTLFYTMEEVTDEKVIIFFQHHIFYRLLTDILNINSLKEFNWDLVELLKQFSI